MPGKNSRRRNPSARARASGPGALALVLLLAALFLYQAWQNYNSQTQAPGAEATAGPTTAGPTTVGPDAAGPTTTAPITTAPLPAGETLVEVFFSDPSGAIPAAAETRLVDAIAGARQSVDMAIYNLSLPGVADALIAAHRRGVRVRMVMETEAIERSQPQRLIQAGIPVAGDRRDGLMHNKFTIIDGREVWSGSMNYTSSSFYKDFNNLLRLPSAEAAHSYTTEFEEMFIEDLFGADTRSATPYPLLTIGAAQVEIYFSPDDEVAAEIISEIRAARESIDFMAYSFTSNAIAAAVLERAAAGVRVRGVFDEGQSGSNSGGEYAAMRQDGASVRLDGISGLMHNKVFIIDGETVITGSYNFSRNAEEVNDENIIILHDAGIAAQYARSFQGIYASAK